MFHVKHFQKKSVEAIRWGITFSSGVQVGSLGKEMRRGDELKFRWYRTKFRSVGENFTEPGGGRDPIPVLGNVLSRVRDLVWRHIVETSGATSGRSTQNS